MPPGQKPESPVANLPARPQRTFSLAALMLVVTFICVWLGVTVQSPPLGIGMAILAVPALAREWWYQRAWRKARAPLTLLHSALSFVGSLVVMVLVVAAGSVAFVGVCFPLGLSQFDYGGPGGSQILFWSAWLWGGLAALFVGGFVVWQLWVAPIRQRRRTGQPPAARQRLLAFLHALIVVVCTLAAAGALGLGTMCLVPIVAQRDSTILRVVTFVVGLAGFVAGGVFGYWQTCRSLASAAPFAAGCMAGGLGHGIGWIVVSWVPPAEMTGPYGLVLVITLLGLMPLTCGVVIYCWWKIAAQEKKTG